MFDVAVVGCGPTGVVLAALLGQAGLSVHASDRLAGVHEIPRAIALDHEVMRLFQQIGVAEAVLPFTEPFTDSTWYGAQGQLIRRMTMLPPPHPQGWTPSLVFTQPAVERVLRGRLAALPGVTLALGTETVAIAQDAESVSLRQRGPDGGESPVRARWVVACDGGSSSLRGSVGIDLEDLDFDEPWLVVDVQVNERGLARLPATSVQYCEPDRPCTMVIGPGNHRRWEISLKPGEDPAQAATPEGTWALLARWIAPDEGTLWRQASYRFHALVAERWRAGRVFVAGDAAHMQPPFLGQGMCQGLRDAANLAWKLADVARGRVQGAAAEALLDSYGAERKAHVRALTTRLKGIGAIICERDPQRARERDARLLAECGGVVTGTPRQDVLPRLESGLLAAADTPGRGTLFPQPRLVDGALMDGRCGHGWRLVLDAAWPGTVPEPAGLVTLALGDPAQAERDGVVAAWMQRHGCRAAVIRPDHYVYGTALDAAGLDAVLAQRSTALGH
ncbi:MAG: bifunctional 3-(3-hydroxy-phenyl)propionate/3-hydroxycinnamic acid hydroxylase [Rubrivivax sp.]|nr:bifunctional 3-(3-hydroxy-phenyl)propionate/3-hydroxycinnamic acid hydroxylase [Rubrivivax sp.]